MIVVELEVVEGQVTRHLSRVLLRWHVSTNSSDVVQSTLVGSGGALLPGLLEVGWDF